MYLCFISDWGVRRWLHMSGSLLCHIVLPPWNSVLPSHEAAAMLKLWCSVWINVTMGLTLVCSTWRQREITRDWIPRLLLTVSCWDNTCGRRSELQIRSVKLNSIDTICIISLPNSMFDHLLESSRWDDSKKWSNIGFREEIGVIEIEIHTLSRARIHAISLKMHMKIIHASTKDNVQIESTCIKI